MAKNAMFNLSYGLFVLTTLNKGKDYGCIINTVTQVTSTPNQITIAVNKGNYTHDMIMESKIFTVSVISEDATFDLFKQFGFQSGRDVNKFHMYPGRRRLLNGMLYVNRGTNAYISAKVTNSIDLGTHTLFIAEVTASDVFSDTPSATYTYYFNHIKPGSPAINTKKEPPKKDESKPVETKVVKTKWVWICKICGFVYDYPGETLPEDYVCPLCKHPASDFERVEIPAE